MNLEEAKKLAVEKGLKWLTQDSDGSFWAWEEEPKFYSGGGYWGSDKQSDLTKDIGIGKPPEDAIKAIWRLMQPAKPDCCGTPISAKQVGGDHYVSQKVQPWDVIDTWPANQRIGFYRGNAIKYLMRMGNKDHWLQEAKKAQHYIEKLIETIEGK